MIGRQATLPANVFVEFKREDTDQTIAQRFEQLALRQPHRLAIKHDQRKLTYAELNAAANRLAQAILKHPTKAPPVALFCSPGLSTIVASLGALKAGKPFAPLDGRLPLARTKELLAHLGARFVLTDNQYSRRAGGLIGASCTIINIDALPAVSSADNPGLEVSPDALAYVNFTSGSTGVPKGVMWNHRSELFGIRAKTNALRITAQDRISLLRANNVGAGRDTLLALLNGAALITTDLDDSGLAFLPRWLRREEVSVFTCVATIFRHALRGLSGCGSFPAVRLIHIGGEPVFKPDVELYRRYFSDDCLFVSRYSMSETQAVSYLKIDKLAEITGERVPAGYPLEGNEVSIVDDDGHSVAPGEMGEIAVRSDYLALGYWRQPELTRAKFLPDSAHGTKRTYLTGDLGYQTADGCLVHVGRKDFQAKIRGHRVELGAIESALHQIASIKQAVVVNRRDLERCGKLIAYVVPDKRRASSAAAWRAHLQGRLPAYMVPSQFVILDRLPLTAGGKVDCRSLPDPPKGERPASISSAAPQSALEKLLARFWSDVFGIDDPDVRQNFVEIGGDSLQAAQVVARIHDLFHLDPPLASLTEAPSIEELACFITAHEKRKGESEKIADVFLRVESLSAAEVTAALEKRESKKSFTAKARRARRFL
jgi:amino acid adenylation domain-containing protein